ncbi:hypothetical protein D3C84_677420 [compost metagenome]
MQICIDVVFDQQNAMGVGQLYNLPRHDGRKTAAGRVVMEAVDEQPAWPVFEQQRFKDFDVRPSRGSWHFDHADAVQFEQVEQQGITRAFNHDAITRLEQCSHNQVKPLTGSRRGYDSILRRRNSQVSEAFENLLTQRWQAQRRAVVEQTRHVGAADLADRITQIIRLAPTLGQPAAAQPQLTRA